MKASELLVEIRENLKDYPIEYLRNKVTDDRYKDPLTKSLAKYNSEAWDEIFALDIQEDYDIKEGVAENLKNDIDFYFDTYAGGDEETREFTKYISLYLALMAKGHCILLARVPQKIRSFWKMVNINARLES